MKRPDKSYTMNKPSIQRWKFLDSHDKSGSSHFPILTLFRRRTLESATIYNLIVGMKELFFCNEKLNSYYKWISENSFRFLEILEIALFLGVKIKTKIGYVV